METKTMIRFKEAYNHLLITVGAWLTIIGILLLIYMFVTEGGS